MTLTCLLLLCLPAAIEVTIAPDQPMPFIYFDDPLILEIYSDSDVEVSGTLTFDAVHSGEQTEVALAPFFVRADTGYWHVVQEAPGGRGYFTIDVNLRYGEEEHQESKRFCRIDRPAALQPLPVYAHCGGDSETCVMTAVKSVGIETVRIAAGNEHLEELADGASLFGMHVILALSPGQLQSMPEHLADQIQARCESILRFEVECQGVEAECGPLMETFRQTGCPASISILVPSAAGLSRLLEQAPNLSLRHISLVGERWPAPDEVRQVRHFLAQYGLEGSQIHVASPSWHPRSSDEAPEFLHRFFEYRAAGASQVGLNAGIIADDVGTQELMAYLNGLALLYSGQSYIGESVLETPAKTPLFRSGSQWLAVVWSERPGTQVSIPLDGAVNVGLYDAFGNALELPESQDNGLTIVAGASPFYVRGTGGTLPGRAAVNRLQAQTRLFLAQEDLRENLPGALIELLQKLESEPRSAGSRLRYLELLRYFPRLEEQWHSRQLPKNVVVPALMQLSNIALSMAVIEEDRGELFLEPLSDMLARAEEFQSLYLTGSAGTARARERGDWILSEVRRLVEKSEAIDRADRKIEAVAVAALAEARAQCLRAATLAEVPQETSELTPLPTPTDVETPEATSDEGEPVEGETGPEGDDEEDEDEVPGDTTEDDAESVVHVIVSGDNLFNIARKYGVSLDDLLEWNNLTRNSILRINQELVIRGKKAE